MLTKFPFVECTRICSSDRWFIFICSVGNRAHQRSDLFYIKSYWSPHPLHCMTSVGGVDVAYSFPWLIRKCFYDIKRWYNWKLCHISIFVIHIKYKATSTLWFSHAVVCTHNNLYIFAKKYLLRFYKMTLCCIWQSNMLFWPLGSWKSSLQKPNTRPIVNKANWMDGLSLYALLSFVAHIGDDSGKQHGLFLSINRCVILNHAYSTNQMIKW